MVLFNYKNESEMSLLKFSELLDVIAIQSPTFSIHDRHNTLIVDAKLGFSC